MKITIIWALALQVISINLFAQLGPGGTGIVNGHLIEPNTNLSLSKPKYLSAGYYHNLAIKNDGSIIGQGWNEYSQSTAPKNLVEAISVAGGYYHSIAVLSSGDVVTWGRNNYGQGDVPAGLSDVIQVEAGHGFSMALTSSGSVIGWGRNNHGQLDIPNNY